MTDDEKYRAIINMESIGTQTAGKYPTKAQFIQALTDGRSAGDYERRVVIVSLNPQQQYRFGPAMDTRERKFR